MIRPDSVKTHIMSAYAFLSKTEILQQADGGSIVIHNSGTEAVEIDFGKRDINEFFHRFGSIPLMMVLAVKFVADIRAGVGFGDVVQAYGSDNRSGVFLAEYIKTYKVEF